MTDPTLTPEVYGPDHANPDGLAVAKARADSAAKREPLPAGCLSFCAAERLANEVASRCTVAFWMERHPHDVAYHRAQADLALHSLADLFGYRLEAK